MRALPLAAEHERLGARFGELAGWRVPLDYGDAESEQRAVRGSAGLIDWSAKGKTRVTGGDRLTFLDGLLTNDLKTLLPGRGLYAATLDHKGRVRGDLVVHHLGGHYLLETEPEATQAVLGYLNRLLVSDDVTMADATAAFAILGVFGPQSPDVVERAVGALPASETYAHAIREDGGFVVRNPYFGGEGFQVWTPPEAAAETWRALLDAGASPFGAEAADALRIEAGRPKFPTDMDEETLALEARLEDAISMTKGCYVGQEVVSRATYVGHLNRFLVGLEISGDEAPKEGATVLADGRPVGRVTSAAHSASLGTIIALGYVRREKAEPGTEVTVRAGADVPARVAALPFVH